MATFDLIRLHPDRHAVDDIMDQVTDHRPCAVCGKLITLVPNDQITVIEKPQMPFFIWVHDWCRSGLDMAGLERRYGEVVIHHL